MEHPILLICRVLPTQETELTEELIDKIHLVFSATDIHHSKNRDECYKIITEILPELELITCNLVPNKRTTINPSNKLLEIKKYYGI